MSTRSKRDGKYVQTNNKGMQGECVIRRLVALSGAPLWPFTRSRVAVRLASQHMRI